jgi:hypothetical protein
MGIIRFIYIRVCRPQIVNMRAPKIIILSTEHNKESFHSETTLEHEIIIGKSFSVSLYLHFRNQQTLIRHAESIIETKMDQINMETLKLMLPWSKGNNVTQINPAEVFCVTKRLIKTKAFSSMCTEKSLQL